MMNPNCRLLPNEIYDLLPEMTEAEIKVVMTIWAETFSVGRADVALSNDDLIFHTHLSANSVISGVKGCLDKHQLIVRKKDGHGFRYSLKLGEMESDVVEEEAKPKAANPTWLMIVALAKVMRMDAKINAKRLGVLAKELVGGGYTPEQIAAAYGQGGRYWSEDWRAKQANPSPPNASTIRETVLLYTSAGGKNTAQENKKFVVASDGGTYV